jgi:predicted small secreted protein
VRSRWPIAVALVAFVVSACGSTATTGAGTRIEGTRRHIALPAGPNPSVSAKMVCANEAQRELASTLGVSTDAPITPTWVDHLYSCRYVYTNGAIALSVKEVSNRAQTTAYFDMLGQQLGRTGALNGLGQGAFTTTNGDVVVRKDYKVLLVDISGLPAQFGVPPTSSADIAVTVADVIMGCWSGE